MRKIITFDEPNIPTLDNSIKRNKNIFVQALVYNKTFTPARIQLETFSHDYEELSVRQTINGPVHYYSIEQIYFAITTNRYRIRETIEFLKFWAITPGIRCLMVFESKSLPSENYIQRYLATHGISCKIQTSNATRYEERYLELIQQVWYSSNTSSYVDLEKVAWFAFGDDDTVWFLNNLLQTLKYYNASDPIYLGNISDNLDALQRHGTYFAFGGGGILLSRTLALQAAQQSKDCQRLVHNTFGGDMMIGKCINEILKINLTKNKNFHQMDHIGDMDGFLESGIEGLVSLHHMFSYWEPFSEEHATNTVGAMNLFKLAYQKLGHHFLKRYVRLDRQANRTFLLTMGYSFSLFDRILTHEELMKVEKTWCCSDFVGRQTRPKEMNKTTWYFRAVTNETSRCEMIYEYNNVVRVISLPMKLIISMT
ncbi:unnamed protein product [Rotaria sp. Silwood1]|nr:unnamed protein product [Rotaria sp. Silwood1]